MTKYKGVKLITNRHNETVLILNTNGGLVSAFFLLLPRYIAKSIGRFGSFIFKVAIGLVTIVGHRDLSGPFDVRGLAALSKPARKHWVSKSQQCSQRLGGPNIGCPSCLQVLKYSVASTKT